MKLLSILKKNMFKIKKNKSYSQFGQDKYVYSSFFKGKKDGFFIEVGVDDGVDKSNTLFFEEIGWKGICIEPSPIRFKSLERNRNCILVNKAIHVEKKDFDFIDIVGYGKGLSGIVENYNLEHFERIEKETTNNKNTISKSKIKVSSIPLSEVIETNKVRHISYLSIDVEGGEQDVLKSINFDSVLIDVISVENNYEDKLIKVFLSERGFKYHTKIGIDDIYLRKGLKIKKQSIFSKLFS